MQRRLKQVCSAVREHSAVNIAKMATAGGFCNVDLIVLKATSPNDIPLQEKYVHELLKIFSISQPSLRSFSLSFTRRFGRTKSWRVALKCLLLLHRLLRSPENNGLFQSELLWSRTNGLISLFPCRFSDCSSTNTKDYTLFIRKYAHLLDEALNSTFLLDNDKQLVLQHHEEEEETLPDNMKEVSRILELLPQLQTLIDRVIECRPVGSAAKSFVVKSAMKSIVRDSFACYGTIRRELVVVLDHLFQMPYSSCAKTFGVYKRAAEQADELCEFHDWCKEMGLCGFYEYPLIERIPVLQIQALDKFLNGMWQFTDSESSSSSPMGSSAKSISSLAEDEEDTVVGVEGGSGEKKVVERKFCLEEEKPLIQFEVENEENSSWETLLEASVNMSPAQHKFSFNGNIFGGFGEGYNSNNHVIDGDGEQRDGRNTMMMIYNPKGVNPFNQPLIMQDHNYGQFAFDYAYSRGAHNVFTCPK